MAMQYDFAKDNSDPSWRDVLEKAQQLLYATIHRREGVDSRPIYSLDLLLLWCFYSEKGYIVESMTLKASASPLTVA